MKYFFFLFCVYVCCLFFIESIKKDVTYFSEVVKISQQFFYRLPVCNAVTFSSLLQTPPTAVPTKSQSIFDFLFFSFGFLVIFYFHLFFQIFSRFMLWNQSATKRIKKNIWICIYVCIHTFLRIKNFQKANMTTQEKQNEVVVWNEED